MSKSQIEQLAAEANEIRNIYTAFWGAHSSRQIAEVGVEPTFPETPILDLWFPRDGAIGKAGKPRDEA